jgi:hypothetical protein
MIFLYELYERLRQRRRIKRFKRQLPRAVLALQIFDRKMKIQGWGRVRQRQFWHRFVREPEFREAEVTELMKEVKHGS